MIPPRSTSPNTEVPAPSEDLHARTRLLIGNAGLERLRRARILVAGLGGVGGYAAEALVRAGTGTLIVADADRFGPSNLNRQILADRNTLGSFKTQAAARRFSNINPDIHVEPVTEWITPERAPVLLDRCLPLDALIDAIDEASAKAALLVSAVTRGIFTVSCMGAGARWRVSAPHVADLSATRGCPLARVIRRLLREQGIQSGVTCVFFDSPPDVPPPPAAGPPRPPVGSISYPPGLIGLTAAGVVIERLVEAAIS